MATMDVFLKSGAIFRLSLPAWLRLHRAECPATELVEEVRIRRDFVLEMMQAYPEAFAHEESLRDMMYCISRR